MDACLAPSMRRKSLTSGSRDVSSRHSVTRAKTRMTRSACSRRVSLRSSSSPCRPLARNKCLFIEKQIATCARIWWTNSSDILLGEARQRWLLIIDQAACGRTLPCRSSNAHGLQIGEQTELSSEFSVQVLDACVLTEKYSRKSLP